MIRSCWNCGADQRENKGNCKVEKRLGWSTYYQRYWISIVGWIMPNKDGVCTKAEWHNYLIFKHKHTTSLTLRKISSKRLSVCWQFMKRNGFFNSDNTLKRSRHPFCVFLLLFWVGNSGGYFFLMSVWKIQAIFFNYDAKVFLRRCMRAKPVKRALTSFMYTCAFNSFATPDTVSWVQAFDATIIWLPRVPPTNHS